MHVIQRCPEVPVGPHRTLHSAEEELTPPCVFLAVPGKRRASVEPAQLAQQDEDVPGFDQRVAVIRQHTPRHGLAGVGREQGQQIVREGLQARRVMADLWPMLETSGSDMEV